MTEALATLFEGKEIRILQADEQIWFPLMDLSLALGLDRTTLRNHVDRNKEMFEGCLRLVDKLSSSDLNEELLSVNEEGLYLLLARISTGRLKNPLAKEAIKRFRKESSKLIQRYRKKEITQISQKADIRTELLQAKEYAEVCGHDAGLFQAAVFKKHGLMEFAEALKAPSLIHGETGWYIPTQLGEMCALTATQLNHWLNNKGYQYREQGVWRLQPAGELHGQEYWFEAPSGHREIRIRWRESILYASGLKREIPASQLMLPARA